MFCKNKTNEQIKFLKKKKTNKIIKNKKMILNINDSINLILILINYIRKNQNCNNTRLVIRKTSKRVKLLKMKKYFLMQTIQQVSLKC